MCCSKSWKAVSFGQSVDIRVLRTTKGEEVKNGVESVGARPRAEATEEKGQRKVDVVPPPPSRAWGRFAGCPRWLEVEVRTGGPSASATDTGRKNESQAVLFAPG